MSQGILPDVAFPQLYDVDEVGESALEDAMPWDMIQPAIYDRLNHIAPLLPQLNARHEARTADNVDFNYLRSIAAKSKENAAKTHLSLNEAQRLTEKAQDDAWRLELENSLRKAKGKALAETIDQLEELEEAEIDAKEAEEEAAEKAAEAAAALAAAEGKQPPAEALEAVEDDALIEEAGRVLLDLIGLSLQIAQLESLPAQTSQAVDPADQLPSTHARTDTDG